MYEILANKLSSLEIDTGTFHSTTRNGKVYQRQANPKRHHTVTGHKG